MKKKYVIISTIVIGLATSAYKIADDIITRLGLQHETAQYFLINNMVGSFDTGPMDPYDSRTDYAEYDFFRIPRASMLPGIITGDKAGAAKELCEYIKKFVSSEEFATGYKKRREDAMPLTDRGSSLANLRRDAEVFQININNYKTDTKYVAEQQQRLDETMKRIAILEEAAKKPFQGKETWEKKYPADPAVIVKKRLQEYLQLVATVDFTAKLTEPDKYKVKKFVNPVYEKKSLKWKAIYRAGKEVNDVVTAFIKDWLKGEIISPVKTKMNEKSAATGNNPGSSGSTTTTAAPTTTSTANTSNTATTTNSNTNTKQGTTTTTPAEPSPSTEKKQGAKKLKDKIGGILRN